MLSLSVCIIAKGEEPFIETTLKSVRGCADEIILVDTGLNSRTRAKVDSFIKDNPGLDVNIFEHPWEDDFSHSRNFSLNKAKKEWILVIDADEFIEAEDIKRLLEMAEKYPEIKGFSLIQKNYTNNMEQVGFKGFKTSIKKQGFNFTFEGYTSCKMTRVFKNDSRIRFENPVHESVNNSIRKADGLIGKTDVIIHHLKELKGPEWDDETQLHYLNIYDKNIDRFTDKAEAYSKLGILYYSYTKDYPKAAEFLRRSVDAFAAEKRKPDPKTLVTFGYAYYMSDDFENAKVIFEQLIDEYPDDHHAERARSALQMIGEKQNV